MTTDADTATLKIVRDVVALIETSQSVFDCAAFDAALNAHRDRVPFVGDALRYLTPGQCEAALDALVAEGRLEELDLQAEPGSPLAAAVAAGKTLRSWQFRIVED